jgi:hypothetical protein
MNWLIERGCPPEVITQPVDGLLRSADDETVEIEANLAASKERYRIRESWTEDGGNAESYVIAEDTQAPTLPVRVFLDKPDFDAGTYRLWEGAFPSFEAASSWLQERNSPFRPLLNWNSQYVGLPRRGLAPPACPPSAVSDLMTVRRPTSRGTHRGGRDDGGEVRVRCAPRRAG